MPNWCENTLICFGPSERLEELRRYRDDTTELSLERIVTIEEDYDHPRLGPLGWKIVRWGTKWDVEATVEKEEELWRFEFSSAWSPPIPVITELSKNHPELVFHLSYSEPGVDVAGVLLLVNGSVISYTEEDWSKHWDEEDETYDDSWREFPRGVAQELLGRL